MPAFQERILINSQSHSPFHSNHAQPAPFLRPIAGGLHYAGGEGDGRFVSNVGCKRLGWQNHSVVLDLRLMGTVLDQGAKIQIFGHLGGF